MSLTYKDLAIQFVVYLVAALAVAYVAEVYFRPKGQLKLEKLKAAQTAK